MASTRFMVTVLAPSQASRVIYARWIESRRAGSWIIASSVHGGLDLRRVAAGGATFDSARLHKRASPGSLGGC
jgi:hypothetical protein